ncbi:MAG: UDP-N-acetylmuramoyl-L-alanyl-D-glutamate--2,6-diaminopimelate ligase [Chloroflexi bacterium]|nr:UDP-N-acetylmuramoyl-L-alanyl-D-glutamate--2,6-diaminopimelate ligase [Chloroflexota bacterium]
MHLSELLERLPGGTVLWSSLLQFSDPVISGISYDTRKLHPGDLFVAVREAHGDGHAFLQRAVELGASALVVERPPTEQPPCPVVLVENSKRVLAYLSAAFFNQPGFHLRLVGVTGTDGKTTTTELTAQLLRQGGIAAGFMTTVALDFGRERLDNTTRQTTLESPDIQAGLAKMLANGCRVAALEATSHALALHRLESCPFDTAIVTNVTHEHLDFHGTWDNYVMAKAHLLELVATFAQSKPGAKTILLNKDDQRSYERLKSHGPIPHLTYGLLSGTDLRATDILADHQGLRFTMHTPWGTARIATPLAGEFNVYNCLAAAGAALIEGVTLGSIIETLHQAQPVPGRMERIDEGQPFTVIVDYAHTADSIQKVLTILRRQTSGTLWAVFGSAGERDREKRPAMGTIAAQLCDHFVLTNEDPRREDPERILDEIAMGAERAGRQRNRDFFCIADRRAAIAFAFEHCRSGDTVLLAGKGHEQCILVGDDRLPWDDRIVARELLHGLAPQETAPRR